MEATILEIATTPPSAVLVAGDRTRFVIDVDGDLVIVLMTKKANGVSFEADAVDVAVAAAAIAAAAGNEVAR